MLLPTTKTAIVKAQGGPRVLGQDVETPETSDAADGKAERCSCAGNSMVAFQREQSTAT